MRATLVRRAFDLGGLIGRTAEPEARASLSALRAKLGDLNTQLLSTPEEPAAIDFDQYRKTLRNPKLADAVESYLAKFKIAHPAEQAEFKASMESLEKEQEAKLENAYTSLESTKRELAAGAEKLDLLRSKRTSYDTTLQDMYEKRPGVEDEIEQEINDHDWGKDI